MRCKFSRGRLREAPLRPLPLRLVFRAQENNPDRAIKVLEEFVEATAEKGPDALVKEYMKIDQICDPGATFEAFQANMTKNRYSDVLCRDSTRVRLWLHSDAGDYIHANEINHPSLLNKFICTQGPLSSTIYDFWRMIFQERAESVLMLCRPAEEGRPKCVVYWPQNVGESLEFASLTVTNRGEESDEFNTITFIIEITKGFDTSGFTSAQKKSLIVKLFRWTTWPDRGVPDESTCFVPLRLLDRVRRAPTVVHCSAGIGRTGSVLVVEIALQKIAAGKAIDVEQITRELRRSRCQCVQTEIQYLYIHRVLVENALGHVNISENAAVAAKKFLKQYDERMTR